MRCYHKKKRENRNIVFFRLTFINLDLNLKGLQLSPTRLAELVVATVRGFDNSNKLRDAIKWFKQGKYPQTLQNIKEEEVRFKVTNTRLEAEERARLKQIERDIAETEAKRQSVGD